MEDVSPADSTPGPVRSTKKNANYNSKEQRKLDELNEGIDILSKRLSRRQAIATGAVAAAAVVGGLVIGGAAGYLLKPSTAATSTTTVTSTLTGPTVTQTITSTPNVSTPLSNIMSSTSSIATGGPGIDYYYDPSLKGLTVNYVAGAAVEHTIIDPFFAQFTK